MIIITYLVGRLLRYMRVAPLLRFVFPARDKKAKQSKEIECFFHGIQIPKEMFNPLAVFTKSLSMVTRLGLEIASLSEIATKSG